MINTDKNLIEPVINRIKMKQINLEDEFFDDLKKNYINFEK